MGSHLPSGNTDFKPKRPRMRGMRKQADLERSLYRDPVNYGPRRPALPSSLLFRPQLTPWCAGKSGVWWKFTERQAPHTLDNPHVTTTCLFNKKEVTPLIVLKRKREMASSLQISSGWWRREACCQSHGWVGSSESVLGFQGTWIWVLLLSNCLF